jgi:hypothetical protein
MELTVYSNIHIPISKTKRNQHLHTIDTHGSMRTLREVLHAVWEITTLVFI